jgi:hypothetical protein
MSLAGQRAINIKAVSRAVPSYDRTHKATYAGLVV